MMMDTILIEHTNMLDQDLKIPHLFTAGWNPDYRFLPTGPRLGFLKCQRA
jgi:hypothetical protein